MTYRLRNPKYYRKIFSEYQKFMEVGEEDMEVQEEKSYKRIEKKKKYIRPNESSKPKKYKKTKIQIFYSSSKVTPQFLKRSHHDVITP